MLLPNWAMRGSPSWQRFWLVCHPMGAVSSNCASCSLQALPHVCNAVPPPCSAVYSGCASYNPATFEGGISAGCDKHVAVGPNKQLAVVEPAVSDVAVTASGLELWLENQWLTYADPTYGR